MAKDGAMAQDGTLNATGTCNANLEFDTLNVKDIFADFDRAVATTNRYLVAKEVQGTAKGFKDEDNKKASIIVSLKNRSDYNIVEKEIREQLKMRRDLMTSYKVKVELTFEDKHEVISNEIVEWDQ